MRTYRGWCLVGLLLWAAAASAAEPQGKVVQETWEATYLEGGKAGWSHTTVREVERDGKKLLRTTKALDLTVKRGNAEARLRIEEGTDETPEGKVLGVVMRQFLGDKEQMVLTGVVEDDQLHLKTGDGKLDKKVPWNDEVIGLYGQDHLFQKHKVKPGDRFTYLSYEPIVASVVTIHVTVKDEEEVEVLGAKKPLLRVEEVPDKVQGPQGPVPLPSMTHWLDKDLLTVRAQTDMAPLGKIVLYRAPREVALAKGEVPKSSDPLIKSLVRLNRSISRPDATRSVVYRITVKDDDDPASTFAQDDRQTIKDIKGSTFELHVRAIREPRDVRAPADAPKEFTTSCPYITSDDVKVKEYAGEAVGQARDPWRKAQLIERWLRENVRPDDAEPFEPADKVAARLKGDCRHNAMLGAALCRAVGIPSRTAVGLIYDDNGGRGDPVMAFHMWTEVWVKGQWLGIDGTRGLGSVGADHVKIADSSWHDVESLTPLLPVARVVGKVSMEVIRVNGDD
jgi:transglutaminase-like putative cysteine protease